MPEVTEPQTPAPAEEPPSQDFAALLNDAPAPTPDAPSSEAAAAAPAEPPAQPAPQAPAAAAPPAPTAAAPTPALAAAAPAPSVPVEKFRYQGREYTPAELAQSPDVLRAIVTSAEQLPSLQKKYLETLEAARTQPPPQPVSQQPQGEQPRVTARMIETAYEPELKRLAEAEEIEPDAAELYPKFVSQALFLRDTMAHRIAELERRLAPIDQWAGGTVQERQRAELVNHITGNINQLATRGGPFDALKDQGVRESYFRHLVSVNPTPAQLTPDFFEQQFAAFQHQALFAAAVAAADGQAVRDAEARRTALGAGGGSRPARAPTEPGSHLDFLNSP